MGKNECNKKITERERKGKYVTENATQEEMGVKKVEIYQGISERKKKLQKEGKGRANLAQAKRQGENVESEEEVKIRRLDMIITS